MVERVDVGYADGVGHDRSGSGAATWTNRDAVVLGPVDEIRNDQEIVGEAHCEDYPEFVLGPLENLNTDTVSPRALKAFEVRVVVAAVGFTLDLWPAAPFTEPSDAQQSLVKVIIWVDAARCQVCAVEFGGDPVWVAVHEAAVGLQP